MSETTKDTTPASADGNDVSASFRDRLDDINRALNIGLHPGILALQEIVRAEWSGLTPRRLDGIRCAIEWIAERLASEVTRIAEMADAAAAGRESAP